MRKETLTPDKTAHALEDWLPRSHWGEINDLLVGFGQTICKPMRPQCYRCKIKDLCPYTPKTKEGAPSVSATPQTSKKRETTEEESKGGPEPEEPTISETSSSKVAKDSKKRKIEELEGFKF